jgi:hypothetical protein
VWYTFLNNSENSHMLIEIAGWVLLALLLGFVLFLLRSKSHRHRVNRASALEFNRCFNSAEMLAFRNEYKKALEKYRQALDYLRNQKPKNMQEKISIENSINRVVSKMEYINRLA